MSVLDWTGPRTTALLAGSNGVQTLNEVGLNGARVRVVADTQSITASDANSTIHFARLPSNARILALSRIMWDDLASSGSPTLDIGTFNPPTGPQALTDDPNSINDGLVISAVSSGFVSFLADYANLGKRLWELAGLSADPKQMIDIKGTVLDASTNATGDVAWEILYTVD